MHDEIATHLCLLQSPRSKHNTLVRYHHLSMTPEYDVTATTAYMLITLASLLRPMFLAWANATTTSTSTDITRRSYQIDYYN